MTITLAQINQVILRESFLPWYRQLMADYGIPLPVGWQPSDEELARIARTCGPGLAEIYRED